MNEYGKPVCVYDTDSDGDCQLCWKRGGCVAIGGPFERQSILNDCVGEHVDEHREQVPPKNLSDP